MTRFRIEANDGGSLSIDRPDIPESWYWNVEVRASGLIAAADVDSDMMGYRGSSMPLGAFFQSLGADWRGWEGERTWTTFSTLTLRATHDGLGHVEIGVDLEQSHYPDAWRAQAILKIDAGALDGIARAARRFQSDFG